ncbi:MAG: nickel-responsive transcriptional regulator NikR [Methanothrix sp.]|jgi:CopG family nickel-responsive transcriptional regulator|nr:nickel-responsive transcriptional regulator NikR [Methanothrix sp.]HPW73537.1 nickel-responsive transcriptional regulator NikR [Methanothrix sp.]
MRIGVSLPEKLLSRFDEIILKRGYSSRSEGIRDAIRNYIVHYEWMSDVQGERVGVITLVYSHSQRGLVENLTEIQHDSGDIIQSTLHVHLDHDNCLEVIVLRGEGKDVRIATEKMMALKGVKHVKLTTTSLGKEL